jgi:hypothetical protein
MSRIGRSTWRTFRTTSRNAGDDPDHSLEQRRFVTFGVSSAGRLLVVAHAEDDDDVRIISAREAPTPERKLYEEA